MSIPPNPTMNLPQQPQAQGPGVTGQLMQAAQSAMNAPAGQPVPTPPQGGGLDAGMHPMIAKIIQGLSQAAQSFGWTAMQPQERLQRTELNQNKAATLAQLANTGTMNQSMIDYRTGELARQKQDADTRRANEESEAQNREAQQRINQSKLTLAQDENTWKQATAQGHLDVAHAALEQRAKQFEEMLQVRVKQVGIDQAKMELGQEANAIKAGMLDVARQSLAQKGTIQGAQMQEKISSWDKDHWALGSIFGTLKDDLGGLSGMNQSSGASGLPGVTNVAPTAQPTPTGVPVVPGKSTTSKGGSPGGATHLHFDAQGNLVK